MKSVFTGSCVALVTPFKDDKVDYESLGKLIDFQINNGTDAIVVLGTTGEPATLTSEERDGIIKFARKKTKGKVTLIVGTGSNSTIKAINDSRRAQKLGADALLIVTPYYNKCTQKGLISHYKKISDNVNIPIIAYNVPGRTGVNILPETALELSKISNICGIKEANASINQIMRMCSLLKDKMAVYSGEDSLNYIFMTLGASGGISVTANVFPKEVSEVIHTSLKGEFKKALSLQEKLEEINKNMFIEVNPIPVKYACSLLKLCENSLRLPLTNLEEQNEEKLKKSMFEFYN